VFGQRIAQKILLGYVIPLAVLVVAGVFVPAALSAILGRVTGEYQRAAEYVEKVSSVRTAAIEAQNDLRDYALTQDDGVRRRFEASRREYERLHAELAETTRALPSRLALIPLVEKAGAAYQAWRDKIALPQIAVSGPGNLAERAEMTRQGRRRFARVRGAYDHLLFQATNRREQRSASARLAENFRAVMTWVGPALALLLALLIGRSISLGVTRPLEALTRATEELSREQKGGSAGASAALLLDSLEDDAPDDEVGDLQRAFGRMARTIGQREAVLRAQNQALGALNRRVEAVLNATNDGIVLVSQNGGFSVVNQRAGDLLGMDPEILLDQTFEQGAPLLFGRFKEPAEARARFHDLLPDGQSVADETFELAPEGQPRVLRVYSAPVRGEIAPDSALPVADLLGRIFVFRDVTRETVVDRMKTEFISVVSHELRTPLTAIKGYVDLMLGGQTGPVTPLQTEFLGIVQSSTARLTALINDMLDISRIESGRIEVKRDALDFAAVTRDVVATLRHQAEAKQIALTLDLPAVLPPVSGDADRITQALINLVSNAVKYTPARGRVRVRVEATHDSFVTTCVEDTGMGIGAEDLPRVFQKFFRADNSLTREASGTGLGLAITRAIIEKLNGSIWVESEPGQGSRFFFTLPTAEADPLAPAGAAAAEADGASGALAASPTDLILCVDDDPALVTLLTRQLAHLGFSATGATSAPQAWERIHELRPAVITLDVRMKNDDEAGLHLLRALKENPTTRDIPVVLVSGHYGAKHAGERLGAFAFLRKPIDEARLTTTLRAALADREEKDSPTAVAAA